MKALVKVGGAKEVGQNRSVSRDVVPAYLYMKKGVILIPTPCRYKQKFTRLTVSLQIMDQYNGM